MTVAATRLDVAEWQLTLSSRLAEITHSGSGGVVQRKKVVDDGQWSCNLPWDSENIPDVDLSLDVGDEPALVFYAGDSGKFYSFNGIVEQVQMTDNNLNDAVRFTASGYVNGAVTHPVT